jgi:hypothetical protein
VGLTLYFSTRITPFDRFLVEAIIFGTLDRDTDCRVVEFQERGDTAIVRLQASNMEDLVKVADVLHGRIWEAQERAEEAALVRLANVLQLNTMADALSALVDKIDRMELRSNRDEVKKAIAEVLGSDAIEMLHDQGTEFVTAKWKKALSTRTQKVLGAAGKTIVKKVAGEVGGVIEGEVKDAVKKLVDPGGEG